MTVRLSAAAVLAFVYLTVTGFLIFETVLHYDAVLSLPQSRQPTAIVRMASIMLSNVSFALGTVVMLRATAPDVRLRHILRAGLILVLLWTVPSTLLWGSLLGLPFDVLWKQVVLESVQLLGLAAIVARIMPSAAREHL